MSRDNLFFNIQASMSPFIFKGDISEKKGTLEHFTFLNLDQESDLRAYQAEIEECRELFIGRSLDFILQFETQHLIKRAHPQALIPVVYHLLRQAVSDYVGINRVVQSEKKMLCLCYAVTEEDIYTSLINHKDFDLAQLISETKATSACASCTSPIIKFIDKTRLENGLIKGLDHSRSRFLPDGSWIKINNMYPGPLVVYLDELIYKWREREEIMALGEIEIVNIHGFHVDLKFHHIDKDKADHFAVALSQYLKQETGILFFLTPLF